MVALLEYFDQEHVKDLDQAMCDDYHHWRCEGEGKVGKGKGNRTVEMELNTLSNAMTWAARKNLSLCTPCRTSGPAFGVVTPG